MKWLARIPEKCGLRYRWHGFFEEFQLLGGQVKCQRRRSCDVSNRMSKTGYKPAPDRIADDCHYDGDCPGRFFGRLGSSTAFRNDNVHPETDQLGREIGKPCGDSLRISALDGDVPALDIA